MALFAALFLSFLVFLALPFSLIQSDLISLGPALGDSDKYMAAPESIPEPPPPEENQEEIEKPELEQESVPLSLSQIELALLPGTGDALRVGGFSYLNFGLGVETLAEMEIFELRDLDRLPEVIFQARPYYPFEEKREGIEGWVKLIIVIDDKGSVIDARVVESSNPNFEKPSRDALRKWIFDPGIKKGKRVAVRALQKIEFLINAEDQ